MAKYLSTILWFLCAYSALYVGADLLIFRTQVSMFIVGMAVVSGLLARKIEMSLKK